MAHKHETYFSKKQEECQIQHNINNLWVTEELR